ncbi:MAG: LysM peptidoglycan-binding domain-containing protein [Treponema sp.]|nr:LysM peptidoglycan-binding domain-containing protein [Treponema sp.]
MKTVGIKLADGSFYPVMEEGTVQERTLDLTTAHNNQTCVMVDMYRSKTCSMDDAEYIDTLKIENLNAHTSGEPNITFSVGLDENNQLTANIVDPETGAESNSTITLVSRTIEERLQADDYSIAHSDKANEETEINHIEVTEEPSESENNAALAAGVVAGAGLLAVAGAMAAKEEEPAVVTEDEPVFEETAVEESALEETNEKSLEETAEETTDETVVEETPAVETESEMTAEEALLGNNLFDDDSFDSFPGDDVILEDPEMTDTITEDDFNLGDPAYNQLLSDDFSSDTVEENSPATEEAPVDEFTMDSISDDFGSGDSLDDFKLDEPSAEDDFKLDDITDDSFNMDESSEDLSSESLDLPDFDEPADDFLGESSKDDFAAFDIPDFNDSDLNTETNSFDDPGFDDDDFTSSDDSNMAVSGGGISFTGLYDKETELGESGGDEEKRTKIPVIICVVCAIICLLATALILFVIPSKFNLIKKSTETTVIEKTEEVKPAPAPAEETASTPVKEKPQIPAKEDEIVIIPEAETVIPLPPPVVKEEPEVFTYKIKWGDTLWDIADTFYKNPWRYKDIAKYNHIKNPDHIISGTIIQIPED